MDGSDNWNEMKISTQEVGSFWEFVFHCPGCGNSHGFKTSSWPMPEGLNEHMQGRFRGNNWTWNGDFEKPTVAPSLNVQREIGKNEKGEPLYETKCHSFVEDGNIRFLGDCKHELVNQTIPLEVF